MKIYGYVIHWCWVWPNGVEHPLEPHWNHKVYKTKRIAEDAVKHITKDPQWCTNLQTKVIPVFIDEELLPFLREIK